MSEAPSPAGAPPREIPVMRLIEPVMHLATDALGVASATVTARRGGDVSTVFAGEQRYLPIDEVQYATGEGPCLTVMDVLDPIPIDDLHAVDERWPAVADAARTVGAASSLSVAVPLADGGSLEASVNYYTTSPRAWSDADVVTGARFAAQVGDVLASAEAYQEAAKMAEGLGRAMRTRAVIEQAKGVIMATTGADADEAFHILKDESQHTNVKLREVAAAIVERARRRDEGARGASPAETERPGRPPS